MQKNFSVLLSVNEKENPIYFRKAMNSLYKQTFLPKEIVLVVNGLISEELEEVIKENQNRNIHLEVVRLDNKASLGMALNEGLKKCRNEIVARIDTDNLARPYRFEKEYKYLEENEEVACVGGFVAEFKDEGKTLRTKEKPLTHEEIVKYAKLRNPMHHMTVMYRKSCVLEVGGYLDKDYIEDYDLWTRLLVKGYKFRNLNDVLVDVRIKEGFEEAKDYYEIHKAFRKFQKEIGFLNGYEYLKASTTTKMAASIRKLKNKKN